ncbi:MAG TPA: tRNA (adenosine(37)-N6)-dimethylallyltransferase MiaA [Candidatus Saccharimonadales bacterium]
MESAANQPPLIVIVGETASGKSALAMQIAEKFNGEIICADSRTIYKDMDIGTAKPSVEDRARVPHHLLDVVSPAEQFTVADFKRQALAAIADIISRGKVPLLVGGSGLYVDAVIYDFQFRTPADPLLRERLQQLSVEELQQELINAGVPLPTNPRNPRHLIRSLETNGQSPVSMPLRANTLLLGLSIDRARLIENVTKRVEGMFARGFIDEARGLIQKYGVDAPALQAPGYKAVVAYLEGNLDLEQMKERGVRSHLQLAKRQRTWFKRNKSIRWCKSDEVVDLVTTFLNK